MCGLSDNLDGPNWRCFDKSGCLMYLNMNKDCDFYDNTTSIFFNKGYSWRCFGFPTFDYSTKIDSCVACRII